MNGRHKHLVIFCPSIVMRKPLASKHPSLGVNSSKFRKINHTILSFEVVGKIKVFPIFIVV